MIQVDLPDNLVLMDEHPLTIGSLTPNSTPYSTTLTFLAMNHLAPTTPSLHIHATYTSE